MILVGYDDLSKAYRYFDYNRHKIIISRDVVFNENQLGIPAKLDQSSAYDDIFLKFLDTNLPTNSSDTYPTSDTSFPLPANLPSSPVAPSLSPTIPSSSSPPITSDPSQSILPSLSSQPQLILNPPPPIPQPPRRSSRFRKQSVKLDDYILSFDHEDFDICTAELNPDLSGDNLTYAQASHHPGWQEAMHDEMCSILKNQTWDLVKLLPGKRAITAKWVYKTKPAFPSSAPRLKARLVARGFQQRHGIDYEETFAPVVKWSIIRALTARAAQLDHAIHHLDVKMAFLYGHIHEEVFMHQPQGYVLPGYEDYVCKLKRALYGLRQSPRMWYERIHTFLISLGMSRSSSDYNMYFMGSGLSKIVLVLYVDDLFITGGTPLVSPGSNNNYRTNSICQT
jgi:hypothetical protein